MDYLNKLPVELWEEIVSELVVPFDYKTLPDSVALHPAESISHLKAIKNQQALWRILLISRALCALVIPILYREVYIKSNRVYCRFLASAKELSGRRDGHKRGEWTKEIYIQYTQENNLMKLSIDGILFACPNVIHLSVRSKDGIQQISWKTDTWSSNIRSISLGLPNINSKDLRYLAKCCPRLTTLRLYYCEGYENYLETITFPSLTRLSLSQNFVAYGVHATLDCPKLQILHIQVTKYADIRGFINRHAATLTHLKIYPNSHLGNGYLCFPAGMLNMCKALKWLSFEPIHMNPITIQTTCEQLVHLDLVWRSSTKPWNWKQHAEVFSSSDMFPNLSIVTVSVTMRTLDGSQDAILKDVELLFPRARVEVKADIPSQY